MSSSDDPDRSLVPTQGKGRVVKTAKKQNIFDFKAVTSMLKLHQKWWGNLTPAV